MVAMHVASANPQAVDPSGLDPAAVEREKNVLADKFKAQGKPANVIEKIVEFGLKTFYKEVCLLDQPFIHDDKKTVAQAVKEAEGKVGGPIKVTGFVRFALGEGVERQADDFGGEVAALAGAQLFEASIALGRSATRRHAMQTELPAGDRQALRRSAIAARKSSVFISRPSTASPPIWSPRTSSAFRSASWSAAAMCCAAPRFPKMACRVPPPTPWACWRRS